MHATVLYAAKTAPLGYFCTFHSKYEDEPRLQWWKETHTEYCCSDASLLTWLCFCGVTGWGRRNLTGFSCLKCVITGCLRVALLFFKACSLTRKTDSNNCGLEPNFLTRLQSSGQHCEGVLCVCGSVFSVVFLHVYSKSGSAQLLNNLQLAKWLF